MIISAQDKFLVLIFPRVWQVRVNVENPFPKNMVLLLLKKLYSPHRYKEAGMGQWHSHSPGVQCWL